MQAVENDTTLELAVMRTLTYFDLFDYPLKSSEVLKFLPCAASLTEVDRSLMIMAAQKQIAVCEDMFSLQFDPMVFQRRKSGNTMADAILPRIQKQADLILKFPFVRSAMASGSFSKNFMDENSDFDFFVVCATGRIWISRMLLVIYKRLFLNNSHKHFCVNYFVDETHLEIGEQNIFTATELATVLPLNGFNAYRALIACNQGWLLETFPNFVPRSVPGGTYPAPRLKRFLEFVVNIFFGSTLNKLFKWMTIRHWKKKYVANYSPTDFNIAFKSTDNVSKNHPRNFQKKILERYHERIQALSKKAEVA
ncbi:MAG TPA: hypothetical protein VGD65_17640 [Chryseosolibacter sp.]